MQGYHSKSNKLTKGELVTSNDGLSPAFESEISQRTVMYYTAFTSHKIACSLIAS